MTLWRLAFRSLIHDRASHLVIAIAIAIAGAILIAALIIGDCVRHTLQTLALNRIGQTQLALVAQDRFVRADIAAELTESLDTPVIPAIILNAVASTPDSQNLANNVQLLAVNSSFNHLNPTAAPFPTPEDGDITLNPTLARQLNASPGDTIILRFDQPSALSRDIILAADENTTLALRLKVKAIADPAALANFSLLANQSPPHNAFINLQTLQSAINLPNSANLLLAAKSQSPVTPDLANSAFKKNRQLKDAQLEIITLDDNILQLQSSRVFLDTPTADAALCAASDATPIFSYLVNELAANNLTTPYSTVTAIPFPNTHHNQPLADDHIIINQWLADDLALTLGQQLTLTYYTLTPNRSLEEQSATFTVAAILPMDHPFIDPAFMPPFPGLTDSENCRDWQTGSAIDLTKIRDRDEQYWDDHAGSPKAFITLSAGQKLWQNPFGKLTAIRYTNTTAQSITAKTLANLKPQSVNLTFTDIRTPALAAANPPTDFAQLFLGLSFFLIIAATLLVAMLFVLLVEKRILQTATLLSLGLLPSQIRKLFLIESLLITLIAAPFAHILAIFTAKLTLAALNTLWADAIAAATLSFYASTQSLVIGYLALILVTITTVTLAIRRQTNLPPQTLLTSLVAGAERCDAPDRLTNSGDTFRSRRKTRQSVPATLSTLLFTLVAILIPLLTPTQSAQSKSALFFLTGILLLLAAFLIIRYFLHKLNTATTNNLSLNTLAIRNFARRPSRSLTVIITLAVGCFLILTITAFHINPTANAAGAGGYNLFARSTLPILKPLQTPPGTEVIPFRLRTGDNASCLNLNFAQQPEILAAVPTLLADKSTFSLPHSLGTTAHSPWLLLNQSQSDNTIPAIADQATITWAIKKKLGDIITYTDDHGRTINLKLVAALKNSIFQGSLIISEDNFTKHFPASPGRRVFLIKSPPSTAPALAKSLTYTHHDHGMQITPTTDILANLASVQNTYLAIFQSLGALALILGSASLAVVILRNTLERRAELATMAALGFTIKQIHHLIFIEHAFLIALGLTTGLIIAIITNTAIAATTDQSFPLTTTLIIIAAILIPALLFMKLATILATKSPILPTLSAE